MTMMALWGAFGGSPMWAADPDFSRVSDILGGKKHLLRQDDLAFTSTQVGTSLHQTAVETIYSANSTLAFKQTVPRGVGNAGEVGALLRLSAKTVYRLAKADPTVPVLKLGGAVRFRGSGSSAGSGIESRGVRG